MPLEAVDRSVVALFRERARCDPERLAVTTPTRSISFAELDGESSRLARALLDAGASSEPIGVLIDEGIAHVAAMLGVLKAGSIYVPLTLASPMAWNAGLLREVGARLLIVDHLHQPTARALAAGGLEFATLDIDEALTHHAATDLDLEVAPRAFASLLFTSGSSGKPKGIVSTHRKLLQNVRNIVNQQQLETSDTVLLVNSFAFRGSVKHIIGALLSGATLAHFDPVCAGLDALADQIDQVGATVIDLVPSVFRRWLTGLQPGRKFPSVRQVYVEGERASVGDAALFRDRFVPGTILVNGYSSTETGPVRVFPVDHTTPLAECGDGSLPIGFPVEGLEVILVDEQGCLVGPGVDGEIIVRGVDLAGDYWHATGPAGSPFGPVGPDGRRSYRTGDIGRFRPDGCLEFHGRMDAHVKVRGKRVELENVEAALRTAPGVKDVLVVARDELPEDRRLVAYLVFESDPLSPPRPMAPVRGQKARMLRRLLMGRLPSYAIPSSFVALDAFPLLPTGRIDRSALPFPEWDEPYVAPRNATEQHLTAIWEEVMGLRPIGVCDDFFELGGHSLLAADLMARLRADLGASVPLETLFTAATIESLAAMLAERPAAETRPRSLAVALRASGSKAPLFLFPGSGGHVFGFYDLVQSFDPQRPVFGLQLPEPTEGLELPETIPTMASRFISDMLAIQPEGPFHLAGYSFGGFVAFEVAQQLTARGLQVALLALFDSWGLGFPQRLSAFRRALEHLARLGNLPQGLAATYLRERCGNVIRRICGLPPRTTAFLAGLRPWATDSVTSRPLEMINRRAKRSYTPTAYAGHIVMFRATERPSWPGLRFDDHTLGWARLARGGVEDHPVPGDHLTFLEPPHVASLAAALEKVLE